MSAVSTPTMAMPSMTIGACEKSTAFRPTMYTPAVTIVAAWMRADTGVGPSIASGSQTNNGICALFPVAPTNSSRQMTDSTPKCPDSTGKRAAASCTARKSKVPNVKKMRKMPRMNPQSPMRFVMKAFFPASAALFFSYQ